MDKNNDHCPRLFKFSFFLLLIFLVSCNKQNVTNDTHSKITLVYKTSQNELSIQQAQIIQQQLREVGIDLKIQNLEWATFYSDILSGNFSIYSLEWVGIKDPDFYYEVLNSKSIPPNGLNRGQYNNFEIDKLTDLGRKTSDHEKRKEIYSKVQKIAAEELPYIPLWHKSNIAAMRDYVKDFELYSSGDYHSFAKTQCVGKNNLIVGLESEPTILDPRFGTDAASSRILQLICPGLLKYDIRGDLLPDIAESWEIKEGRIYTFYLRKKVMFHHGRELTASDVKFTIESIIDPDSKSPKKGGFNLVEKVEAPDKYTFKVYLKEVNAAFIHNMQIGIIPEDLAIQMKDDFQTNPVGAGPFRFKSWERGHKLILAKNEDYFGETPLLEEIQFKVIKENTMRLLELEKGTIDFLQNDIPPDLLPRLMSNKKIKVIKTPSTNFSYIGFNLSDPLLSKIEIRKAIAYAIDRDKIIQYILKGDAQKATGFLSPSSWAYETDVIKYDYNPTKAKELLFKIQINQTLK